ncbi:beta-lactamase-like protein [Earliella scabrosa]|nr:beta-lactamase-like protein [Earliella scabrosa]
MPLSNFLQLDPGAQDMVTIPSLCFLLRHSVRQETFVFDLGAHKDWATLDADLAKVVRETGSDILVPQDVKDSLRKGGLAPTDITHVCISHIHIDHVGNPTPYTNATYLVGAGARALPDPSTGHTQASSNALFAALPQDRVRYLDPAAWPPLGPFPHALDFYGDGSLYIVDAPGHLPGHVNVLARTSADGGWVYLAGDSAHDWRLITGEARIARTPACMHVDVDAAEAHIARIARLREDNPRARVLLAHDVPWYEKNKGGDAFWPGEILSL